MKNLIIILTIFFATSIVQAQTFDWAISGEGNLQRKENQRFNNFCFGGYSHN